MMAAALRRMASRKISAIRMTGCIQTALVDRLCSDHVVARIQQDDAQFFLLQHAHLTDQADSRRLPVNAPDPVFG